MASIDTAASRSPVRFSCAFAARRRRATFAVSLRAMSASAVLHCKVNERRLVRQGKNQCKIAAWAERLLRSERCGPDSGDHTLDCPRTGLLARRAKTEEKTWARVARGAVSPEGQVVPQQWPQHPMLLHLLAQGKVAGPLYVREVEQLVQLSSAAPPLLACPTSVAPKWPSRRCARLSQPAPTSPRTSTRSGLQR